MGNTPNYNLFYLEPGVDTANFLNADEHFDPIAPFNDDDTTGNYIDNFSIYTDISDEDKQSIAQTLLDNLNKKGVIDNNSQYPAGGYDVDKSTNPTGRDSKIYIGFKE